MKMKNLKAYLARLTTLTVKMRLIGVLGLLCVMLLVGAWIGLGGMARANESARLIYQDELIPLTSINEVARGSLNSFISLSEAAFHKDDKAIVQQKLAEVAKAGATDAALLKKLGAGTMSPAVKKQWNAFESARGDVASSMTEITDALNQADDGANALLYSDVLPNVTGPVLVLATLDIGTQLLLLSGLSFLGLGAKPPTAEWGSMVASATHVFDKWWVGVFPGLAILTVVLAFNFLGDTMRDALDPRTARAIKERAL